MMRRYGTMALVALVVVVAYALLKSKTRFGAKLP